MKKHEKKVSDKAGSDDCYLASSPRHSSHLHSPPSAVKSFYRRERKERPHWTQRFSSANQPRYRKKGKPAASLLRCFRLLTFAFCLFTFNFTCLTYAQECSGDQIHDPAEGYVARAVKVRARFNRIPAELHEKLDALRFDANRRLAPYSSADITAKYIPEARAYLNETPGAAPFGEVIDDAVLGINKAKAVTISAKFYDACVTRIAPAECARDIGAGVSKCVDVEIRTFAVRLNTGNVAANILPFIPRSNKLTFFKETPRPLLVLNPTLGASHDREFGIAASVGISTNLMDWPALKRKSIERSGLSGVAPHDSARGGGESRELRSATGNEATGEQTLNERNTELMLDAKARKSLTESFYHFDAGLSLRHTRPLKRFENVAARASFAASNVPHGEGKFYRNAARFGASTDVRLSGKTFSRIHVGADYRWSSNRFFSINSARSELTSEHGFEARATMDGRVANGFTRLSVWADGGFYNCGLQIADCGLGEGDSSGGKRDSYRRVGVAGGYQKEFPVALNQAIGVEAIFGAGRAWGNVPEYARFYGGNSEGSFLYDAIDAPSENSFLAGPLLRGVGERQAGVRTAAGETRGGTSFWHANLNVTIPVPGWSRPLIPAVEVGAGATLKQVLKRQVASGKPLFIVAAAKRRLSVEQQELLSLDEEEIDDDMSLTGAEKEAKKAKMSAAREAFVREGKNVTPEADKIWGEITPITNFVADHANIYSVKPLVMFDAARVRAPDAFDNRTRFAVGAGLQLTVVVAKFEAGYLRNVRRLPGDDRGNFIMRLVFQNLF